MILIALRGTQRVHQLVEHLHDVVARVPPALGGDRARVLQHPPPLSGDELERVGENLGEVVSHQQRLELVDGHAGIALGGEFNTLATATVRAVASGVIGIACIQALLVGELGQLTRAGQPRRSAADDRHATTGRRGDGRAYLPVLARPVGNESLQVADGHRHRRPAVLQRSGR